MRRIIAGLLTNISLCHTGTAQAVCERDEQWHGEKAGLAYKEQNQGFLCCSGGRLFQGWCPESPSGKEGISTEAKDN